MKIKDKSVAWIVGGVAYDCAVYETPCPYCGHAVVALPPPELAKQSDGTTHVCLPVEGGCNHGFAVS